MPKQDKPKPNRGERNPNRSNGKASKKGTCCHRKTRMSEAQKVIFGDGMYVSVAKRWAQNA